MEQDIFDLSDWYRAASLNERAEARWYGLRARGVKLELEGLAYLDRGAILHWEFSHFVVFDRLRKDGVEIVDPASGRRLVSFDQFNRSFTGVALTLSPAEEFRQTVRRRNVVWSYVRQFLGQTQLWARIVVISALLQLFALGLPILTGTLVDRIIPRGDAGLLQAAVFLFSYRRYQDLMSQDLQTQAKAQSYLVQMLAGIETLKANGVEERAVEQWSNLFVEGLNVSLSRGRLSATVDSLMSGLKMGSPLLVMWFGGWLALNGDLSLGTMLALNALAAGFLSPVSTLISTALQLQLLRSYVERIDDVLAAPPEQDKNQVAPAPTLQGEIELRDISFTYSANSSGSGVRGVSVKINRGQKVAIVGQSCAGKSTLAKLLLGLYRPSSGNILYDGTDLAGYDLRSVRRQCGIVTQRSHLFSGTIRDNISLNDPGIPLNAVIEASRLACLHADVAGMPMGKEYGELRWITRK